MSDFNPCPDSTGLDLFELWESLASGDHFLVAIAGSPADWMLKPGDTIVRRRWAPASSPAIYNEARREADR